MSFRDEFLWSKKTYAEWSLENTTKDGFQGNQERLNALQKQVKSTFEQGIDRIAQSHAESSAALQGELAYQVDRIGEQISQSSREIVSAVERSSDNIVHSIQQMSDYLGSELCEVRWAVERQTKVSERILEVMLNSLSNESRQYFEQGVKCYETSEYEFARERFSKALEANRTNHFAYQYLGFVAVAEDNSDEAIRNFDLARKFAESDYHRALALSHLARSKWALNDRTRALELAEGATKTHSPTAKFWYDLASYSAQIGNKGLAVSVLREAIERDWLYWSVVATDVKFNLIRADVNELLNNLRLREKENARQAVNKFKRALDTARNAGCTSDLQNFVATLNNLEQKFSQDNVFLYREILPEANDSHDKVFKVLQTNIAEKIRFKKKEISDAELNKNRQIGEQNSKLKQLEGKRKSFEQKDRSHFGVMLILVGLGIIPLLLVSAIIKLNKGDIPNWLLYLLPGLAIGIIVLYLFDKVIPLSMKDAEIAEQKRKTYSFEKQIGTDTINAKSKLEAELREFESLHLKATNNEYM